MPRLRWLEKTSEPILPPFVPTRLRLHSSSNRAAHRYRHISNHISNPFHILYLSFDKQTGRPRVWQWNKWLLGIGQEGLERRWILASGHDAFLWWNHVYGEWILAMDTNFWNMVFNQHWVMHMNVDPPWTLKHEICEFLYPHLVMHIFLDWFHPFTAAQYMRGLYVVDVYIQPPAATR